LSTIDKVHFLNTTLVTNDSLAWVLNSAVQSDDELINKALLTLFKEMVEVFLKLFELVCRQYQLSLHLWRDLLEERKFFNNEVVVIQECLVDVLLNVVVKIRLNMEWFV